MLLTLCSAGITRVWYFAPKWLGTLIAGILNINWNEELFGNKTNACTILPLIWECWVLRVMSKSITRNFKYQHVTRSNIGFCCEHIDYYWHYFLHYYYYYYYYYYYWRPLWSSGQSSCYRSRGPGFDSWRYQIFWELVGLERDPLILVSTIGELLERKSSGFGLQNRE
jgi:hypothetical protein